MGDRKGTPLRSILKHNHAGDASGVRNDAPGHSTGAAKALTSPFWAPTAHGTGGDDRAAAAHASVDVVAGPPPPAAARAPTPSENTPLRRRAADVAPADYSAPATSAPRGAHRTAGAGAAGVVTPARAAGAVGAAASPLPPSGARKAGASGRRGAAVAEAASPPPASHASHRRQGRRTPAAPAMVSPATVRGDGERAAVPGSTAAHTAAAAPPPQPTPLSVPPAAAEQVRSRSRSRSRSRTRLRSAVRAVMLAQSVSALAPLPPHAGARRSGRHASRGGGRRSRHRGPVTPDSPASTSSASRSPVAAGRRRDDVRASSGDEGCWTTPNGSDGDAGGSGTDGGTGNPSEASARGVGPLLPARSSPAVGRADDTDADDSGSETDGDSSGSGGGMYDDFTAPVPAPAPAPVPAPAPAPASAARGHLTRPMSPPPPPAAGPVAWSQTAPLSPPRHTTQAATGAGGANSALRHRGGASRLASQPPAQHEAASTAVAAALSAARSPQPSTAVQPPSPPPSRLPAGGDDASGSDYSPAGPAGPDITATSPLPAIGHHRVASRRQAAGDGRRRGDMVRPSPVVAMRPARLSDIGAPAQHPDSDWEGRDGEEGDDGFDTGSAVGTMTTDDLSRVSGVSATSTAAVMNAPIGKTPVSLTAAGLVIGSGMADAAVMSTRHVLRSPAGGMARGHTTAAAAAGTGLAAAQAASPAVASPRPAASATPASPTSPASPLQPAHVAVTVRKAADPVHTVLSGLVGQGGKGAHRPSTALNEDEYDFALVINVGTPAARGLAGGGASSGVLGPAWDLPATPHAQGAGAGAGGARGAQPPATKLLASMSSEGATPVPPSVGDAGRPQRAAQPAARLRRGVDDSASDSDSDALSVSSGDPGAGELPALAPPRPSPVAEAAAVTTPQVHRPLARRVTWSRLPAGDDGEADGLAGLDSDEEEGGEETAAGGAGATAPRTPLSPLGGVGRRDMDDAAARVCARILKALHDAGLLAKRVRSLSRHIWLLKLKAPEWRLEEEAERIRLRMRRKDGGWSRFKRGMRGAFVPTFTPAGVAVDDGGAGEDAALVADGGPGASLFHSSDRQTLLDHILRSSTREGGADLGQGSRLGAHIVQMFPLHMEARLQELRSDWLAIWRPERSHGYVDRVGWMDPAWYAESRLVPVVARPPAAGAAASAFGTGAAAPRAPLTASHDAGGDSRRASWLPWTRRVDDAAAAGIVDDGEAPVSPAQLPGFAAKLAAARDHRGDGGADDEALGGGGGADGSGGGGDGGGGSRGRVVLKLVGGSGGGLDACDERSCCCCAVGCLRCTTRCAASPAAGACGRGCCGFFAAFAVWMLVAAGAACKCRRSAARCCGGLLSQPLDRIAAYYGETVAFYFAWLEFYTQWLVPPAVAGLLLFCGQLYYGTLDIAFVPLFSLLMALWSIVFLAVWKRRNAALAQRWGVLQYEDEEVVRPHFAGTWMQDTSTGTVVRVYPAWRRAMVYAATVPIVLLFVGAMVLMMIFLFATRDQLFAQLARREQALVLVANGTALDLAPYEIDLRKSMVDAWSAGIVGFFKGDALKEGAFPGLSGGEPSAPPAASSAAPGSPDALSWARLRERLSRFEAFFSSQHDWRWWAAMTMPPVIYGVLMPGFDWVFGKLALTFNDWENHATESSYRNHRIAKVFFYRFVTSFVSLFYYAFSPQHSLLTLFVQLAAFLIVGQLFNNILELASAVVCQRLRACRAARRVRQAEDAGLTEGRRGRRLLRHAQSAAWVQARMPRYDTFNDYAELLIQFGYVTFFSWAFPLAPLCALANNVVEMRTDALRLVSLTQRPIAHKAGGIGVWYDVLLSMSLLAVLTNCAHLALTSRQFRVYFPGLSDAERLLVVFLLEHLVLGCRLLLAFLIPPTPRHVTRRANRDAWALARLMGRRSVGPSGN